LHSHVATFHDMLGSHCAELIAGVAITAAAIGTKAAAMTAVRRPKNLPLAPCRCRLVSAYSVDTATATEKLLGRGTTPSPFSHGISVRPEVMLATAVSST
jgi:hypothetical protein